MHPYKTREGGATVTVFVPYDCGNRCPFCINKQEYEDTGGFDAEAIGRSIDALHALTPRCDFVFTGGEPLAEPAALQGLLAHVPAGHRIFINTTLPALRQTPEEDILAFLRENRARITCLNVSRHLRRYVEECPDAVLEKVRDMGIPVRVNCVLYGDYPAAALPAFLERFAALALPIQFRFDYTATTAENLYREEGDAILADLRRLCRYEFTDGCRMRCGYHFRYGALPVTYHRTLPVSTVTEDGWDILYDVIIKQDGAVHSDWDGTPLDLAAYARAAYEPYDLRVLGPGGRRA